MAFLAGSDHALKERSGMGLDVKLGADIHRSGQPERAEPHFTRALKTFEARVAEGADDPYTRYNIADVYALRGDADRALESLERVAAALPALTAARRNRTQPEYREPPPRGALRAPQPLRGCERHYAAVKWSDGKG